MEPVTVYVAFWSTDWEHDYLGVTRYLSDAVNMIAEFYAGYDENVDDFDIVYQMDKDETEIRVSIGRPFKYREGFYYEYGFCKIVKV
jgi:hypothetical protein